jgi:hypothetical protein
MSLRVLLLTLLLTSASAFGQTSDIDTTPFAGRIFPDLRPTLGAKALTKDVTYFVAPFYLNTDGLWLARMTAGVSLSGIAAPTKVALNYSYIAPDGDSDHLDGFGAAITSNVWQGSATGVTLVGGYSDTLEASTRAQAGFIGEATLAEVWSVGADVRWVHTSAGDSIDDIVPRFFAAYAFPVAVVGADYTLDNDVDGESDYSLEVAVPKSSYVFAVGAGKNSTWYVNLTRRF